MKQVWQSDDGRCVSANPDEVMQHETNAAAQEYLYQLINQNSDRKLDHQEINEFIHVIMKHRHEVVNTLNNVGNYHTKII